MTNYHNLPRPFFALAPMDDVTDTVFRQIVGFTAAPDLFFTEFTNVDGLQSPGRSRLLKKLRFEPSETRLVAHIWGLKPENFFKTARQIADGTFARELGLPDGSNFVGIDLNMGCPAKGEVNAGACSALINNRELAKQIIQAVQEGANGKLPVSVKTRLGFSQVDMTWPEFLLGQNLTMLTMHCRTRKDMSKVPARWNYLPELIKLRNQIAPQTLIVANGDIKNHQHGLELAKKYKLDGIMIGRGIFSDPYAFAKNSHWEEKPPEEKLALYHRQVRLFADTWEQGERNIKTLNKFCKIYVNGFDGAKELRERLMNAASTDEILSLLEKSANMPALV